MNFLAAWFPLPLALVAHVVLLLLLAGCAKPAWRALRSHGAAAAAAALLLAVLWGLHAELSSGQLAGLTYHLLGISLITLMLGAPAALWLGTLMLLPYTWLLHGSANLNIISLNALVLLLPPIIINVLIRCVGRKLPPNIFIYIFVNGFLAAAAGMLATGALLSGLLQAASVYPAEVLWHSAFPVFFLLSWGEAFLSGLFAAIFVALAPQLLATYDDAHYLQPRHQIWKS